MTNKTLPILSRIIFLFLIVFQTGCETKYGPEFESRVEDAVQAQMLMYPESRLQDIYKNFSQDRYGPGHLIANAAQADAKLRCELAEMARESKDTIRLSTTSDIPSESDSSMILAEPLGWEMNFVRVKLTVVCDSIVPYDVFLGAFIRSANEVKKVPLRDWKYEWREILHVIERMELDLPDFEQDKQKIEEMFLEDDYVVHHSEAFMEAYRPHYRIVRRDIFQREFQPLIWDYTSDN